MQSDSPLPQEPQEPQVQPQVQPQEPQFEPPVMGAALPRKKSKVGTILLTLFLLIAIGATAWTWNRVSKLKVDLANAQTSLSDLQAEYETLTAEKAALDGELASVKSEIESTQEELTSTQDELASTKEAIATTKTGTTKVKTEIAALKKKMGRASIYNEVLWGWFANNEDLFLIYFRIYFIEDAKLTELFDTFLGSRTTANYYNWIGYILETMVDILEK